MLILTSTSDLLQLVTASAGTVDVYASYVDHTTAGGTPGRKNTAITTATTTTIVASPAASTQRQLRDLIIRNKHATDANLVTLRHTDGTTAVDLAKVNLAAGEALCADGEGRIYVLDASGNIKTAQSTGAPSGAAGGVLSGNYPNPGFAVDMATQAELNDHIDDPVRAHDASAIGFDETGTEFVGTDVQTVLEEVDIRIDAVEDHLVDPTAAHAASAISYNGSSGLSASDVEGALDELDSEKQPAHANLTEWATINPEAFGLTLTQLANLAAAIEALNLPYNLANQDEGPSLDATALTAASPGTRAIDGVVTVTGGTLQSGDWIELETFAEYVNGAGATRDITVTALFGASTIALSSGNLAGSGTAYRFIITLRMRQEASADQNVMMKIEVGLPAAAAGFRETTAAWTEVTTGDKDFDLKVMSSAGGTQTFQVKAARIRRVPA